MDDDLLNATEDLNRMLCRAEAVLEGLGLGVRAQVQLPGSTQDFLAFEKNGNAWGLRLIHGTDNQPILNASRGNRVKAAHSIPKLVDTMRMEAKAQVDEILWTLRALDDYLTSLTSSDGKSNPGTP